MQTIELRLGRSESAIGKRRKHLGLPTRAAPKLETDVIDFNTVHRLRGEGKTWPEIGQAVGWAAKRLGRWYIAQCKTGMAPPAVNIRVKVAVVPPVAEPPVFIPSVKKELPPLDRGVHYEFLKKGQCMHPLNDRWPWVFCGDPVASSRSYCAEHVASNYTTKVSLSDD